MVEGVRPNELYERYKRFEEIDETEGLSAAEKDALKRMILDDGKVSERVVACILESGEAEKAKAAQVPSSSEVPNWLNGASRNRHAKKHAAEFGIAYRSRDGQREYNRDMPEVIDEYDAVVLIDDITGQFGQRCAVYFRGEEIAVANLDKGVRILYLNMRRVTVHTAPHGAGRGGHGRRRPGSGRAAGAGRPAAGGERLRGQGL